MHPLKLTTCAGQYGPGRSVSSKSCVDRRGLALQET